MTAHDCAYDEVRIDDAGDLEGILDGDHVLTPCRECGNTPRDEMEALQARETELETALLSVRPHVPLFHWAPSARRGQINRFGLMPGRRPTTSSGDGSYIAPVCLADSPSWAWALSGGMSWTPSGHWDLWETSLDLLTEPVVLAATFRPSGLHEVRTAHRLHKRHLWLVGGREKPASRKGGR